ncbi:GNAT family N-acetyltransferase [Mucilaginibacter sp. CSA2-8R]|uniref:GNAT family N-acetyltransferase n=1 Tax=Mucilaginibacter sp. CSA2-8R TaxID=3141542 RepID=UPI00315C7C31
MNSLLHIKPIHNECCRQIIDLILNIQQAEFGLSITINQQPDLLDIDTHYHLGGGCFWGAFVDDELVGTIALINTGQQSGCIRKMFVKKDFRGKEWGTAQQLLDVLLQYCRSVNIGHIQLGTVAPLKAAHRFYERNGFQQINKKDLLAHFPLMLTDTMFFELHLAEN